MVCNTTPVAIVFFDTRLKPQFDNVQRNAIIFKIITMIFSPYIDRIK